MTSEDVPGLVAQAATCETRKQAVPTGIGALIELNGRVLDLTRNSRFCPRRARVANPMIAA